MCNKNNAPWSKNCEYLVKHYPEFRRIREREPLYDESWYSENVTRRGILCSREVAYFLFECFESWLDPYFAPRIRAEDRLGEDLGFPDSPDEEWDLDLGFRFYSSFSRNIARLPWAEEVPMVTVQDLLAYLGRAEREAAIGRRFYGLAPLEYLSDIVCKVRGFLGCRTKKETGGP